MKIFNRFLLHQTNLNLLYCNKVSGVFELVFYSKKEINNANVFVYVNQIGGRYNGLNLTPGFLTLKINKNHIA